MSEQIREQVSAFLDGELPNSETELLLKRLTRDAELRESFGRYALIGEALRGASPGALSRGFAARVNNAIDGEPIGTFYMQKFLGVDPNNGDALYADATGKPTNVYANAARFADKVRLLVKRAPAPVRWFIIDAGPIADIDYSAAQSVRDLLEELSRQEIGIIFARVSPYLRWDMDRYRITAAIGEARIFKTLHEALDAVRSDVPGVHA